MREGMTMQDNTCVCCGKIIPEGRQICLHCGDYDDMQTFKPRIRTHGDQIRAMSNSDLANMIGRLAKLDCFDEVALFNWLESEVKA